MIHAIIYSYKNKNLKMAVDRLMQNTHNHLFLIIYDQNPIDRSSIFLNAEYKDQLFYTHVSWDSQRSPAEYKRQMIKDTKSQYILIMSDDVLVSESWDKELISFLKNKRAVVSGSGNLTLKAKNLFFLQQDRSPSSEFVQTGFVDRNFIFGKTSFFKKSYPIGIKYHGEEESSSIAFYESGVKVFSVPEGTYEDLGVRTIENRYTPFSLVHDYNLVVDKYKKAPKEFLSFLGIERVKLFHLPYHTNDVSYDPDALAYRKLDARRYLETPKDIF